MKRSFEPFLGEQLMIYRFRFFPFSKTFCKFVANQQKDKKKQKDYRNDILHNLLTDYQAWLNLENLYKESMMVRSSHVLYPSSKDMDCFPLI